MSIQRIKILREKREALAKAARREIATLVERGKIEIARIKVENIMNDDLYVQLLEVLELYCETLEARFGLLDSRYGTDTKRLRDCLLNGLLVERILIQLCTRLCAP